MNVHSPSPAPSTLRPGIRTFKPRRSRITRREQQALSEPGDILVPSDALALSWAEPTPVIMDIGFGSGESTLAMARAKPGALILAVDIHTPGVGRLVADVRDGGLSNVRVMEADALVVLEESIPPDHLTGVCTYFPDPWPKARHHKRRIVQPAVLDLIHSRLVAGGWWRLATDWHPYVEAMLDSFAAHPGFRGGVTERPEDRPVTHYERRAVREGRPIVDLEFTKVISE